MPQALGRRRLQGRFNLGSALDSSDARQIYVLKIVEVWHFLSPPVVHKTAVIGTLDCEGSTVAFADATLASAARLA